MLNVLLIDDDADDRFLFGKSLQKTGLEIHYLEADGCDAAIQLMGENKYPDVIFLDINMPGGNGYDCLKKIKSNAVWRHIPVIIYSTSGNPDDVQKAANSKTAGYLKKPDDVAILSLKLKDLLRTFIIQR